MNIPLIRDAEKYPAEKWVLEIPVTVEHEKNLYLGNSNWNLVPTELRIIFMCTMKSQLKALLEMQVSV